MKNKKLILGMSLILLLNPISAANKTIINTRIMESENIETNANTEQKVKELKKLFNITEEYEEFNISTEAIGYVEGSDFFKNLTKDKYIIQYRWSDEKIGRLIITYTSAGDFISYNKWSNEENNKEKTKTTTEDVKKKINEFLPKLIKDFDKNYKLSDYNIGKNDGSFNFVYKKYINDIPSYDDTLNISYSPRDNEFTSIVLMSSYGYYPLIIEDSHYKNDAKIDLEAAKKIFLEKFPLTLSYKIEYGKAEKVYYSEILNIDAKTGKINKDFENFGIEEYAKVSDKGANTNLTEVEIKKIKNLKELKSKKEAEKIAKEIAGDYKVSNINLSSDIGDYFYNIEIKKGDEFGQITLNAKTLKLVNLGLYSESKESKINFKEEDAIKIAREFIDKYADKNEINFEKAIVNKNNLSYEIFFPRYVNNLPVIDEGISINIDGNKKVRTFDRNFTKVDFSKAKDIDISAEEANEIYLNSKDFGLKYQMTKEGPKLFFGSIKGINPLIRGDKILRDSYGDIVNFKEQINYKDIDKAKDKDKINKLKEMNIGLIGRNLSDKITYKDFLSLLGADDFNNRYFIDNYKIDLEKLGDKNIIEKDGVKLLVIDNTLERFIGAEKIFRDDIFNNQKSLGDYEKYYIIAYGFGFIDENINPDREITLEDALYMIYNAIN